MLESNSQLEMSLEKEISPDETFRSRSRHADEMEGTRCRGAANTMPRWRAHAAEMPRTRWHNDTSAETPSLYLCVCCRNWRSRRCSGWIRDSIERHRCSIESLAVPMIIARITPSMKTTNSYPSIFSQPTTWGQRIPSVAWLRTSKQAVIDGRHFDRTLSGGAQKVIVAARGNPLIQQVRAAPSVAPPLRKLGRLSELFSRYQPLSLRFYKRFWTLRGPRLDYAELSL